MKFYRVIITGFLVSLFATLSVLWKVILSPSTYEPFYRDILPQYLPLSNPFFGWGYPNPAEMVTNTFFLPTVVASLLPPQTALKFEFSSAVFLGSLSLFVAFLYFTRPFRHSLLISSMLAYLLSVYPWTLYYDYWPNYYVVPTTLPLAFALADYFSSKYSGWKLGALLALSASLAVSDPRSFVIVPILISSFYLYKRLTTDKVRAILVIISGLAFYSLINLKTVLSVLITYSSTTLTAYNVASTQLFLLNETFPLSRVLALGAEYKANITIFVKGQTAFLNLTPIFYLEAAMTLAVLLAGGLLMAGLKRTPLKFFYFSSLALMISMSSEVYFFRSVHIPVFPTLAALSPQLPFLKVWYWLFLPTYLNEYLIALTYVTTAIVMGKAVEVRAVGLPLYAVVLAALISSAVVSAETGSLFGHLGPHYLPQEVVGAMQVVGPNFYLYITNASAVDPALLNTPYAVSYYFLTNKTGLINGWTFALMGVPYYLSVGKPVLNLTYFREVYHSGDITVYRSTLYNSTWKAKGIYLVADYPYDAFLVPKGYFAVPWFYPVKNVSGVVGNSTPAEGELYALLNEYSINPLTLPNFTSYISYTVFEVVFLNAYPGAPLYEMTGKSRVYLNDSYLALAVLNSTLPSTQLVAYSSQVIVNYDNATKVYHLYYEGSPEVSLILIGPVKGYVDISVQGLAVPVVMVSIVPANAKPTFVNQTVYLYSAASGVYGGGHQFMYWVFSTYALHKVEYNLTLITLSSFVGLGITLFLVRKEVLELIKVVRTAH